MHMTTHPRSLSSVRVQATYSKCKSVYSSRAIALNSQCSSSTDEPAANNMYVMTHKLMMDDHWPCREAQVG